MSLAGDGKGEVGMSDEEREQLKDAYVAAVFELVTGDGSLRERLREAYVCLAGMGRHLLQAQARNEQDRQDLEKLAWVMGQHERRASVGESELASLAEVLWEESTQHHGLWLDKIGKQAGVSNVAKASDN